VIPADVAVMAIGIGAGVIAGLFGVGGGIIFVPTLTLLLGMTQHHAQATSLLAIVPVAIFGTWRERRSGAVVWRDVGIMSIASIITAVAGALLANALPEHALRIGFAGILILTAAQIIRQARQASQNR